MSELVDGSESLKERRATLISLFEENDLNGPSTSRAETILINGSVVQSNTDRYEIIKEVGRGSFGNVFKGRAVLSGRTVAVKIMKTRSCRQKAEKEHEVAQIVKGHKFFVEVLDFCEHIGYPVLVFEYISQNLNEFIKNCGSLPITMVRSLTRQMMMALQKLKECGLIHTDLKPENIMISDTEGMLSLKITDFGGAIPIAQTADFLLLQSLHYRAPEIILGTAYSEKVDMWSAGCIFAEMLVQFTLYPGRSEYDQLILMVQCQDMLPYSLLYHGRKTPFFFNITSEGEYIFKKAEEFEANWGCETGTYFPFILTSLEDVANYDQQLSLEEKMKLLSFLELILHLDQDLRFSPKEALEHEFLIQDEGTNA